MKKLIVSLGSVNEGSIAYSKLTVTGALVLKNAIQLKEGLQLAFNNQQDLRISLTEVTEVDLSCLQLLICYQLAFKNAGKAMAIQIEASQAVEELLLRSGLSCLNLSYVKQKMVA